MFVMKRKRLHRLLVGSMLAVIVLVSLVNPVMANQGKVKMIAYDHGHEGDPEVEIYKDVVEEFNRRTDVDATIEYRFIAGDAYYPRINAMIAANDAPDIFSSHAAGRLKTYVDAGKVYPLNEAFAADPEWKSQFKEGVFDHVSFDGQIYAMPTSINVAALFYNQEIFAEYGLQPPTTYAEMKEVIEVFVNDGVTPFAFGAKDPWAAAVFVELVENRIGGSEPFNRIVNRTGTWLDPCFIKGGEVMQELVDLGAFPDGFLGMGYDETLAMFMNGQAAMFVMGSWAVGSIGSEDSGIKDVVGVARFPVFEDGIGDIDAWLGQPDHNLTITASAADKDAAVSFLKMWSADEVQRISAKRTGKLTVTRAELDPTELLPLGIELSNLLEDMKTMFLFYDVALGPQLGDEYNNTIQAVLAGMSPEEAFGRLQKYMEMVDMDAQF